MRHWKGQPFLGAGLMDVDDRPPGKDVVLSPWESRLRNAVTANGYDPIVAASL